VRVVAGAAGALFSPAAQRESSMLPASAVEDWMNWRRVKLRPDDREFFIHGSL